MRLRHSYRQIRYTWVDYRQRRNQLTNIYHNKQKEQTVPSSIHRKRTHLNRQNTNEQEQAQAQEKQIDRENNNKTTRQNKIRKQRHRHTHKNQHT